MIGGGHAHRGEMKNVDGRIALPLFRRLAISSGTATTAAAVFAQFVSWNLISLYLMWRNNITKKLKAYKGFNQDMTCIEKQYEEGKTYEEYILPIKKRAGCCMDGEVIWR